MRELERRTGLSDATVRQELKPLSPQAQYRRIRPDRCSGGREAQEELIEFTRELRAAVLQRLEQYHPNLVPERCA